MKYFVGCLLSSFAVAALAQQQLVVPDRTLEQLKVQADNKRKVRTHLLKTNPWVCADFNWKNGVEPEKPVHDVSKEIPPGETSPIGNLIPQSEYPRGMIIVQANGGCTVKLDSNRKFVVSDRDILEDFFDVRETLSQTPNFVMEDGHVGTRYFVRQRNYDDQKKPLDMFSYITVRYDSATEELFVNLKMDHIVANPGDQGNLLKKFREIIHVKKVVVGQTVELKLDSEWAFWAANPSRFAKTFWGTAKNRIKKSNFDWRNDLMEFTLSKSIAPSLIDISALK